MIANGFFIQLETDFGITIESAPISHCMDDLCFGSGCATVVEATGDANPVLTNQTSLIGIATSVSQECVCAHTNYTDAVPVCEANTCANGGMCEEYYNGYVYVPLSTLYNKLVSHMFHDTNFYIPVASVLMGSMDHIVSRQS